MQEAAVKACKQMGYTSGFFNIADSFVIDLTIARPPWVSQAECDKEAESFEDCFTRLGDTSVCGVPMALFCSTDAARTITCRLDYECTVMNLPFVLLADKREKCSRCSCCIGGCIDRSTEEQIFPRRTCWRWKTTGYFCRKPVHSIYMLVCHITTGLR